MVWSEHGGAHHGDRRGKSVNRGHHSIDSCCVRTGPHFNKQFRVHDHPWTGGHNAKCRRKWSTHKCDPPLGFHLNSSLGFRRQLKNCSLLIFSHTCQQRDLTVWKFQRIMMSRDLFLVDLPKDRRLVPDHLISPAKDTNRLAHNLASKRQFGSWSNADHHVRIFGRSKSSRSCTKVARRQLIADFRRAGFDTLEAVVTHLGTPLLGKPLSHLNIILFLFLAHQCESTAHVARLAEINFSMETILPPRATVAIARCAFATYPRPSATWSCRRLSSHSIGIERWRP